MKLTIERLEEKEYKKIIEYHAFVDITGNEWLLEVSDEHVYITYIGSMKDRVSSFKVVTAENQEFKSAHENIFASKDNDFETYYYLRQIIRHNKTSGIWQLIQRCILENPLITRIRA